MNIDHLIQKYLEQALFLDRKEMEEVLRDFGRDCYVEGYVDAEKMCRGSWE